VVLIVWLPLAQPRPSCGGIYQSTTPRVPFGAGDFDFGSRSAPFEGAATHKASGSAGGYLRVPSMFDSLGVQVPFTS
jgi:hypothetical protein